MTVLAFVMFLVLLTTAWVSARRDSKATSNWDSQTKRNTAENFGAFGLGAKVPLSTGVDFYTVETAHNGKLFKMNCFAYKTDFLIGKFQADGHITFSDGTQVNYINTNSTQLHQDILRCQATQPHEVCRCSTGSAELHRQRRHEVHL